MVRKQPIQQILDGTDLILGTDSVHNQERSDSRQSIIRIKKELLSSVNLHKEIKLPIVISLIYIRT